jgi:hypothetical protein
MRAGWVAVLGVVTVLAACGGSDGSSSAPSSESLAERLERAQLCVRVGRVPAAARTQLAAVGVHDAWQCVMRAPANGSTGSTEVVTWAPPDTGDLSRALDKVLGVFRATCSGPADRSASGGSDGSTSFGTTPPKVTLQYVRGDGWLAFVGVNAKLGRVASALGGHAVTRHCG